MAVLEQLMGLDGALASFQINAKGEVLGHKVGADPQVTESVLDLLGHVCVANMAIATMQARGWESVTGMTGFYPVKGISLIGFEWTALTNGEYGVIVPNDKVDYDATNKIFGENA